MLISFAAKEEGGGRRKSFDTAGPVSELRCIRYWPALAVNTIALSAREKRKQVDTWAGCVLNALVIGGMCELERLISPHLFLDPV